ELRGVVRGRPPVPVLGIGFWRGAVRVPPADGEELDPRAPIGERPRRTVEPFDDPAQGAPPRHFGRLPTTFGGTADEPNAGSASYARGCFGRPRRGHRRRGRWRPAGGGHVRRAEQDGEPARSRAPEPRDATGRAPRVVRPELARGHRDDPRRAGGTPDRGAALV